MIFFDLDGTLLDHDYAARQGVAALYHTYSSDIKTTEDEFNIRWESLLETYYNEYLNGSLSFAEQRRIRIRQQFHKESVELNEQEADRRFALYLEVYEQSWRCYEDVVSCLDILRADQHRLGIITNGDNKQQLKKLNQIGIADMFSIIVTSSDAGYSKPHKQIFVDACARGEAALQECYYVGDRLEVDALGSKAAGMKGVWLNRTTQDKANDVMTINRLSELLQLVRTHVEDTP
ncbi:MAG: superfamily hydrolase [Paenibacillus sp.]|jgi:putative hydrolase of the HAD superfamily|nr:superfamily hydrolase [Paenibacillus sp.]